MTVKEYSAYIKGLMEGCQYDTTTPEGKIIASLAEMCGMMADELEALRRDTDMHGQYLDELDADLGNIEEIVLKGDDDECHHCSCCDDEDECGCCDCEDEDEEDEWDDEDEEDDEDDAEFYCVMCPSCGEKVYFDESTDPEDLICPVCQSPILDDEDDDQLTFLDGEEDD